MGRIRRRQDGHIVREAGAAVPQCWQLIATSPPRPTDPVARITRGNCRGNGLLLPTKYDAAAIRCGVELGLHRAMPAQSVEDARDKALVEPAHDISGNVDDGVERAVAQLHAS